MFSTSDIITDNKILTDYLYGVQAPLQTANISDKLKSLETEMLTGSAFMLAIPVLGSALKPLKIYKNRNGQTFAEAWKKAAADSKANRAVLSGSNFWESRNNRSLFNEIDRIGKELPTYKADVDITQLNQKKLLKYNNAKIKSSYYDDARRLVEETKTMLEDAKNNGTKISKEQLKNQYNKILKAMRDGDARVNIAMKNGILKPTSAYGRLKHNIKLKTGAYKYKGAMLRSVKGASGVRLASKCVKGAGVMALLEAAIEIPDIVAAFKIDKAERAQGKKSNRAQKQLLKSGTKVGASILGYAVGAAAAGTIAGSVLPGLGNAAGAIIGFTGGLIGGFIASFTAGKTMDAVTGEKNSLDISEKELYAEEKNREKMQASAQTAKLGALSNKYQDDILNAIANEIDEGGELPEEVLQAFENLLNERESGQSRTLDLLEDIYNFEFSV